MLKQDIPPPLPFDNSLLSSSEQFHSDWSLFLNMLVAGPGGVSVQV
jgi:hypothetical protein